MSNSGRILGLEEPVSILVSIFVLLFNEKLESYKQKQKQNATPRDKVRNGSRLKK